MQCTSLTAAAEVGMALESEAVASAVREADFERMQREAAEAGVAGLHDALEKLKQKLRSSQVCAFLCSGGVLMLWLEVLWQWCDGLLLLRSRHNVAHDSEATHAWISHCVQLPLALSTRLPFPSLAHNTPSPITLLPCH